MNGEETKEFFECLGEIWRDITAIEFLMRCAIAKNKGDIDSLPKPPYTKGKIYEIYPKSFNNNSFGTVVHKFNKLFPSISVSKEIIELRNSMAHGLIVEVNNSGIEELIKFRDNNDEYEKKLTVEFHMNLTIDVLKKLREELKKRRQDISAIF